MSSPWAAPRGEKISLWAPRAADESHIAACHAAGLPPCSASFGAQRSQGKPVTASSHRTRCISGFIPPLPQSRGHPQYPFVSRKMESLEKASQGENYSDYFPPKHLLQTESQNRQSPKPMSCVAPCFSGAAAHAPPMQPPHHNQEAISQAGRGRRAAEGSGTTIARHFHKETCNTRGGRQSPSTTGPRAAGSVAPSPASSHCGGGCWGPPPAAHPLSPGHLLSISSPTTDVAAIQAFQAATKASAGAQRRGAEERLGLKQEPPAGGPRPPPCATVTPVPATALHQNTAPSMARGARGHCPDTKGSATSTAGTSGTRA